MRRTLGARAHVPVGDGVGRRQGSLDARDGLRAQRYLGWLLWIGLVSVLLWIGA